MPVFDAKAKKELVIMDISETEAPVEGGKKIILLCEKVLREDVKVRFWDPLSGWEGWGQFSAQVLRPFGSESILSNVIQSFKDRVFWSQSSN